MGIFDFLRNKKTIKTEAEIEAVAFGNIGNWIQKKEENLLKDEAETLGNIGKKSEDFYVFINEKLEVLEGVDIESKKEHGRAKILVRQGLDKYINSVRILLKELNDVDKNNLEKFSVKVGEMFVRFEKTSMKFYERATYLVGDEMVVVRNEIRKFYNGLVKTFEESSIGDLKRIEIIKSKLGEFERVERDFDEIEKEIAANDLKIDKAKVLVKKIEGEVEDIRNSSEYVSGMNAREEIVRLRAGLDREIGRLKELIDFKRLTNLVHSNERELEIVKDYKAHFVSEFSKDNGDRLFALMAGTKMKSDEIRARLELIGGKQKEFDEKVESIGIDYTVKKLDEVKMLNESIENIELESIKNNRRLENLNLELKGLRNEVIGLVEYFRINVG